MNIFALATVIGVALVMLIVNLGYANTAFPFMRFIPGRDVTGHFVIFGILSFAVVSWASRSSRASTHSVRAWTTAILICLVTLDEVASDDAAWLPPRAQHLHRRTLSLDPRDFYFGLLDQRSSFQ